MRYYKLTHDDVLDLLPVRMNKSHKGNYGKVMLICGSRWYTGAPTLAALGALRTGCGLVYLHVPNSIHTITASKVLEPIVVPLPDTDGHISIDAIPKIADSLQSMDAVLIGPGLGNSMDAEQVVKYVLSNFRGPVVLDADGINVMYKHKDILRGRGFPTVITPHEGEFLRFGGSLKEGRLVGAAELATETGSIVALKGFETVITDGTTHYINTTGNPGMAVGGSGDVLAGIIASLLGQGLQPIKAAACGAWIHGAAGDICAREIGQYGMLPSDILQVLPRLLR